MSWKEAFVEKLFALDARKLDIDGAYRLKHSNLPSAIYKYRTVNTYSLTNLSEGTVWLADPRTLNDPYDCSHFIDQAALENNLLKGPPPGLADKLPAARKDQILEALQASDDPSSTLVDALLQGETPETREKLKQGLLEALDALRGDLMEFHANRIKDSFKLCSFSERVDSSLMWAHYADYHKGYCVEYDIASLTPVDYPARFLYPVIYSDQVFDATELVGLSIDTSMFNNLRYSLAGLVKASDWSYEREWRLVFMAGVIKSAQSYPMPTPRRVYLGSHIAADHQAQVIAICDSIRVEVAKMRHSQSEFKMEAVSVDVADRKRFVPPPMN
jgi:hypothetical protein